MELYPHHFHYRLYKSVGYKTSEATLRCSSDGSLIPCQQHLGVASCAKTIARAARGDRWSEHSIMLAMAYTLRSRSSLLKTELMQPGFPR